MLAKKSNTQSKIFITFILILYFCSNCISQADVHDSNPQSRDSDAKAMSDGSSTKSKDSDAKAMSGSSSTKSKDSDAKAMSGSPSTKSKDSDAKAMSGSSSTKSKDSDAKAMSDSSSTKSKDPDAKAMVEKKGIEGERLHESESSDESDANLYNILLNLDIYSNISGSNQKRTIEVFYELSNPNVLDNITLTDIRFKQNISSCFSNISCINCEFNDNILGFNYENFDLRPNESVKFGYIALIAKDLPSDYSFKSESYQIRFNRSDGAPIFPNLRIYARNNNPDILSTCMSFTENWPIENGFKKLSSDETISFSCEAYDLENGKNLTYEWFNGKDKIGEGMNISKKLDIGNYDELYLIVKDRGGLKTRSSLNENLRVEWKTKTEYYNSLVLPASILLAVLILLFGMFKIHINNLSRVVISMIVIIIVYIYMYVFHKTLALNVGILELFILSLIISYASYFIISSFPKSREIQLNSLREQIIFDFNTWKIWYLTIVCMLVLALLVILIIPELSSDLEITKSIPGIYETIIYNYIFWYYSMMTQTFGAILAIVAMVAMNRDSNNRGNHHLNARKVKKLNSIKFKIKNFIILYTTVIIISICGMIIRTIPPLHMEILYDLNKILPLFIFETTLLLSIPALVCLGQLILDLLD